MWYTLMFYTVLYTVMLNFILSISMLFVCLYVCTFYYTVYSKLEELLAPWGVLRPQFENPCPKALKTEIPFFFFVV